MNLKMIRLSKPNPDNLFSNYENQLEPQYFFTSSVSKTLFENSQRTLLQISEDEIRDYINNDDLCNDEEGMFPKRSVLTGEWYIRSVSFEDDILSIETALLGTDLGYPDHIKPVITYSFSVTLNLPKISENKVITEINRQAIVNRNVIKV